MDNWYLPERSSFGLEARFEQSVTNCGTATVPVDGDPKYLNICSRRRFTLVTPGHVVGPKFTLLQEATAKMKKLQLPMFPAVIVVVGATPQNCNMFAAEARRTIV